MRVRRLFAASSLALAWPLALVVPVRATRVLLALPPLAVGATLGLVGAAMAPQNATCAWLLAVLATAIVVAPRLAAERAVLVSPARLELQLAALALGGTQRQAARLAAAADPAGPTLLLRGLALAATKGMAALALWRIVGAHELVLEGVAMLQERGGIALSLVVILAAPAASRPARSRRASVRRMFRAPTAPHLEATP